MGSRPRSSRPAADSPADRRTRATAPGLCCSSSPLPMTRVHISLDHKSKTNNKRRRRRRRSFGFLRTVAGVRRGSGGRNLHREDSGGVLAGKIRRREAEERHMSCRYARDVRFELERGADPFLISPSRKVGPFLCPNWRFGRGTGS